VKSLLPLLLLLASPGLGIAGPEAHASTRAGLWEVIDLRLDVDVPPPRPWDVDLTARLRGPAGENLEVPGFHDGGTSWVVRVAPPAEGRWTWETASSVPSLAGRTGTIEVGPPASGRHGSIVVTPDRPQRFAFADGTPYFALAFECDWLFALDAEDPDDIPRTRTLVDELAESGFNQVVMNVYAYDVSWPKDPRLRPEHDWSRPRVFPFAGTNESPDYSSLSATFFQRLDRVIRYLGEKGVVAHLMIYVWNKEVSWPDMHTAADDRYFDYVVARYQAFPNVVWDVSKEALAYGRCDEAYIHERIARIRRHDAHRRLVTVHDYAYCRRHPEMSAIRLRHPEQPVLNVEHGGYERSPYVVFEGDYTDPVACLERNYEAVFAGVYSTYYWQASSWYVVIPDPVSLPESERPHLEYYRHLADLFERYDFADLEPSESYSSSGYALSDGSDRVLLYLPKENHAAHLTIPKEMMTRARLSWFDPLTGSWQEAGETDLRSWHEVISPWPGQMSVLVVQKAGEPVSP